VSVCLAVQCLSGGECLSCRLVFVWRVSVCLVGQCLSGGTVFVWRVSVCLAGQCLFWWVSVCLAGECESGSCCFSQKLECAAGLSELLFTESVALILCGTESDSCFTVIYRWTNHSA